MYINRLVQVEEYFELQEQHKELQRRYTSTEDEVSCMWCPRCGLCIFLVNVVVLTHSPSEQFELFKAEHADYDAQQVDLCMQ